MCEILTRDEIDELLTAINDINIDEYYESLPKKDLIELIDKCIAEIGGVKSSITDNISCYLQQMKQLLDGNRKEFKYEQ